MIFKPMRCILMLLAGVCFLNACKPAPKITTGTVLVTDSLPTHIDREAFFSLATLRNSTGEDSVLLLFNSSEKYFLVYDILSKQQLDSVNVKDYTLDRHSRAGLTANGTIYVLEGMEKLVKKINPKTQTIDSFRYEDDSCYAIITQNSSLTILDDSVIFLQINAKGGLMNTPSRLAHFKTQPIAKMVMRDKKLVVLNRYCTFPESYADGSVNDDAPKIYTRNADELWYTFNDASRFCHVQNSKEEVIETGYAFVPLEKIHPDSLRSIPFVKQYQLRNTHVSRLEHLPGQQHVHLYCKPPAPVLDSNGELNSYIDCPNYLLDYDLRKASLRQYLIPKGLDYRNGAAFRDRLVWANTRDDNEFLTLYILKLQ